MDLDTARGHLKTAEDELREIRPRYDEVRDRVHAAILDALRAGMSQREVCDLSGYTRENVRKLARANGIGPA